jgi:hypothetical protein
VAGESLMALWGSTPFEYRLAPAGRGIPVRPHRVAHKGQRYGTWWIGAVYGRTVAREGQCYRAWCAGAVFGRPATGPALTVFGRD